MRDLNNSAEGLDWRELTSLVSGELTTNAVETQLFALAELLGVEIVLAEDANLAVSVEGGRRGARREGLNRKLLREAADPMRTHSNSRALSECQLRISGSNGSHPRAFAVAGLSMLLTTSIPVGRFTGLVNPELLQRVPRL